ncbi:MAG: SAM-dependent methyltransferase, partial [Candidatus Egerieousia sp.]|nr:SAM-dependent methyltransferase [bacterium]MDY5255211.1 SAM-dependent methyltransferase [Candidatus Egerieousia sp.]
MFNKREIEYILENANADCSKLLLGGAKEPGIRVKECVAAILARRKLREKAPLWYNHPAIEYPISLSVEQCSSQETALYKSSIVKNILER